MKRMITKMIFIEFFIIFEFNFITSGYILSLHPPVGNLRVPEKY
jgi:hypothetical protein